MATITSNGTGGGNWSVGATWSGGVAPQDLDTVVIAAGDSVLMDVDTSLWANGVSGLTINGSSSGSPGKLYFANGSNGHLLIRDGTTISGTNNTNRGQLVATSDGMLETNTPVQASNIGGITFNGTAVILAQYLDIKLLASHPINKYLTTFLNNATSYFEFNGDTAVNPTTDTITLGSTPPNNSNLVQFKALGSAVLPAGLDENERYYTYNRVGNTFQLVRQSGVAITLVDITAKGSGTIAVFTGYGSGGNTFSVIEDLASDTYWTTETNKNRVMLVNSSSWDQQRGTISAITNATPDTIQITFTNGAVDSNQGPGSRIYLLSRNVFLRFKTTTNIGCIDYGSTSQNVGIFDCEITSISALIHATPTTTYGSAVYSHAGDQLHVGGIIAGFATGLSVLSGAFTSDGIITGCSYAANGCSGSFNFSGTSFGCNTGFGACGGAYIMSGEVSSSVNGISSSGGPFVISGDIFASNYGVYQVSGLFTVTSSGRIFGHATAGINNSSAFILSGAIFGNTSGVSGGNGVFIINNTGKIFGNTNGINGCGGGFQVRGQIFNNTYALISCGGPFAVSGVISNNTNGLYSGVRFTLHGAVLTNTTDIQFFTSFDAVNSTFVMPISFNQGAAGRAALCRSFRHGGIANDTRGASYYGTMTHTTTEYPVGASYSHKFTFSNSSSTTMFEWNIERPSLGNTITIPVKAYNKGTGLTTEQCLKWELIDLGSDPLCGGTALSTFQSTYQNINSPVANDANFDASGAAGVLSYMPVDDRALVLRVSAIRSSGNAWAYAEIPTVVHRFPVPSFPPT